MSSATNHGPVHLKVWRTAPLPLSSSFPSKWYHSARAFLAFRPPGFCAHKICPVRTQSSNLTSGQPPRSYGALPPNDGTPSNGPDDDSPFCTPSSADLGSASAPGHKSHPIDGPSQRRTLLLVICFAVIETVLIICGSVALAKSNGLESAVLRKERSALVAEREKWEKKRVELEQERVQWEQEGVQWEQERVQWKQERLSSEQEREKLERERGKSEQERAKMRRERELWEKAKEDRVPPGSFWDIIRPASACHAYGKREYWSTLQNVPEGWTPTDACMNTPVEIKDVTVRRPYRCTSDESPHIRGYWIVDWDEPGCKPWWREYRDAVCQITPLLSTCLSERASQGCTSYKSGKRRIEGELVGLIDKKDQDWGLMCATTPLTWNYITYSSPTHCELRVSGSRSPPSCIQI